MKHSKLLAGVVAVTVAVGGTVAYVRAQSPVTVQPGQSIQAALDGAPAGATVIIKAGVYQQPAGAASVVSYVNLSRSGLTVLCEPGAHLRGRRTQDADFAGSGATNSGPTGSARSFVLLVSGSDNVVDGCTFSRADTFGVVVTGDGNILRGNYVFDTWRGAFSWSGSNNVIEHNEAERSIHGGGFGGTPASSTAISRNNVIRYNLSHDHGRYLNGSGQLVRVPSISGDRAEGGAFGGGNSDGWGASKDCAVTTASGRSVHGCVGWTFQGMVAFGNADDDADQSLSESVLRENVGAGSGPVGCRNIKSLNSCPNGCTADGNVGTTNAAMGCPSGKPQRIEITGSWSATRNRAGQVRVNGSFPGGSNVQGEAPQVDLTLPTGTPYERHAAVYNRFRSLPNSPLSALPPYPGFVWGPQPTPSPTPCVSACPAGYSLVGGLCVLESEPQCEPGFDLEGSECVSRAVPTCPAGQALEGDLCVSRVAPTICPPAMGVSR